MKRSVFALVTVALLTGVPQRTEAEPITYTDVFSASGTFGGMVFTEESVVLSVSADTSSIFIGPAPGLLANVGIGTVEVSNVGTATFANPITVAAVQPFELLGFVDDTVGQIFAHFHSAFSSYDLAGPIGPLSRVAGPFFNPAVVFPTDAGGFSISGLPPPVVVTFTASTASPIPEPSSLVLLGTGLAGLAGNFLRRRRN